MLLRLISFITFFTVILANDFGPPCLPTRINYRVQYPCLESVDEDESSDQEARLKGEPSKFAQTGVYDRLFKVGNTRAWQGPTYIYEPTYGYNPNLPQNGPYIFRYSNFFNKPLK
ncbi:unnamed protein product [Haemonchus placei]|uniref:Secreted protein n=1 Tax=Haemonchus placei TaxID=6290 RepID=A0A0N4W349_HAEPC|nr:unnamed protein product [Haemonchus placei]